VSKVAGVRDFIGEQNRYERALAKSMDWDFVGQYAVAYRTQLEFYAWFLQQRMKAEGRSEEVIPIGLNVIFQIDQSQSDINDVSGGGPGLKFKTYVAETELDTSWIEDSIDLAINA
jgi:hypothetical protein